MQGNIANIKFGIKHKVKYFQGWQKTRYKHVRDHLRFTERTRMKRNLENRFHSERYTNKYRLNFFKVTQKDKRF